jgi:hypothetical protein
MMRRTFLICCCRHIIWLPELLRLHAWAAQGLIGGECPRCGSSRYARAELVGLDEAALCGLDVMASGEVWAA